MIKKITIKDVAKEAGVAVSTVSNALNNSNLVTQKTKEKVLNAVEKLNYIPNINGKILKSGKSKTLCLIISNIDGEYFSRLLNAINLRCLENGYSLNIIIAYQKETVLNYILGGQFDGFFLFDTQKIKEKELEILNSQKIKAVILDRKYSSKTIGSVVFDSFNSGYEITKYLIDLGHKHFGFISGDLNNYDSTQRKRGFLYALEEANIPFYQQDLLHGDFNEDVTFNAVKANILKLKSENKEIPSAYVCGNDLSAIGAIKALKTFGCNIPNDISVVGFDDIEISKYFTPTLTTIHNPIEDQGRLAVDLLLELLNDEITGYSKVISGNIIKRKSSKNLHAD